MIQQLAPACSSTQAWQRARRHILSHLVCFGRHTISGLLRLQDRAQLDWTADYRLYAREHLDEDKFFGLVRAQVQAELADNAPLVAAMDDSLLRKTGRKVCGARYLRDPMSPPFHVNFVRGLRVLQISAALPQAQAGSARLIPIDFRQRRRCPSSRARMRPPPRTSFIKRNGSRRTSTWLAGSVWLFCAGKWMKAALPPGSLL